MSDQVPWLPEAKLRKVAADFRKKYGDGEIVFPIEHIIGFDLDLHIIPLPELFSLAGMCACLTPDKTSIYVDEYASRHMEPTYRYRLAHEIGHFELHDEVWKHISFDTPRDYLDTLGEIMTDKEYERFEFQANAFAGLILVPTNFLRKELCEHVDGAKERISDCPEYIARQTAFDHAVTWVCKEVANDFHVHPKCVAVRADCEGLTDVLAKELFGEDHGLETKGRSID